MLFAVDSTIANELGIEILTPFDKSKSLVGEAEDINESNTFYDIDTPTNPNTDIGEFAENATNPDLIADFTNFFTSGVNSLIIIMKLLSGTLIFDTLVLVGIDQVWIYAIQAPIGILVVITIIDYIRSRI